MPDTTTGSIRADRVRFPDRVIFDGKVRTVEQRFDTWQPGAVGIEFTDGTRAPLVHGAFQLPRPS